jgi:hypothetical protein
METRAGGNWSSALLRLDCGDVESKVFMAHPFRGNLPIGRECPSMRQVRNEDNMVSIKGMHDIVRYTHAHSDSQ